MTDDRHLGADERVGQRRLAGIGRAKNGDEAATRRAGIGGSLCLAIGRILDHAFPHQQRRCSRLFRRPLRHTLALSRLRPVIRYFGREVRRMVWAVARDFHILGQRQTLPLRHSCNADFGSVTLAGRSE